MIRRLREPDVSEPPEFVLVCEQSKGDTVNWRFSPSFIIEPASAVEVLEKLVVGLGSEKVHVTNLESRPKVACGVAVGDFSVGWILDRLGQPIERGVLADVVWMLLHKLQSRGPQGLDGVRVVVQRYGEPVSEVVLFHELEHIVVDLAMILTARLEIPVVLEVFQRLGFVKVARFESHLVVIIEIVCVSNTVQVQFLDPLLLFGRVNVGRGGPDRFRDLFEKHLSRTNLFHPGLEVLGKRIRA
ncbi:hypothetical protein OGAPHI_000233 [Ogataea philodendri]|uniref:Uncharacterized protein n=1 Tax=Ogataea philodendri TaxID=1378263 RepID=A0A9P8PHA9_9ASCO|nr:uncharacterized protein OGAPHI_000233 [Ogataea philodendri]KAH3671530.1 hypothetical protein OGAPHI_000233 [Ogataea philodendri]